MHDSLISTCTVEHSFSYYVLQQERRAEATIGRMCTPTRRSGAVAAPPAVRAEYAAGGVRRNRIIQQFLAAGGDKDCRCCEGVLCPIWPTLNPINPKPLQTLNPINPITLINPKPTLKGELCSQCGAHATKEPQAKGEKGFRLVLQRPDEE